MNYIESGFKNERKFKMKKLFITLTMTLVLITLSVEKINGSQLSQEEHVAFSQKTQGLHEVLGIPVSTEESIDKLLGDKISRVTSQYKERLKELHESYCVQYMRDHNRISPDIMSLFNQTNWEIYHKNLVITEDIKKEIMEQNKKLLSDVGAVFGVVQSEAAILYANCRLRYDMEAGRI